MEENTGKFLKQERTRKAQKTREGQQEMQMDGQHNGLYVYLQVPWNTFETFKTHKVRRS